MSSLVWISHRGCQHPFVENSDKAFALAERQGFDFLETDLRVCATGEVVLSHDTDLRRVWADSRPVAEISLEEFLSFRGPQGERPLSFQQFSQTFRNSGWVLDIKRETAPQVLRFLKKWAEDGGREFLESRCRFLLWSGSHERLLRQWLPRATIFPGEKACWRAGLAVMLGLGFLGGIERGRVYSLPPVLGPLFLYRKKWVKAFQRRGAKVLAFLPGKYRQAAIDVGVDEVLTEDPLP